MPVPPPVIWRRKREEAAELALVALSAKEVPLTDQRSFAEIPFGGDPRALNFLAEVGTRTRNAHANGEPIQQKTPAKFASILGF